MTLQYKGATGLNLNGAKIVGMADGSANSDAATWGQVQNFVRGIQKYVTVRAKATGNLTLSGAQTVDGVSLIAGDLVLADAQTTGTQDGVYVVAAGAWSRASDMASGVNASGYAVTVTEGTVAGDKTFIQTADPAVVGTDALTFTQLGGGATYSGDGNGVEVTGTVISLELDGNSLSKSASGLKIGSAAAGAGLTESGGVLAVGAGTGLTVNADDVAVDTGVVTRRFTNAGTHGAGTSVALNHNLGRKSYVVSVAIASTGEEILADVVKGDNDVTVSFGASQGANTILLTVVG